MKNHPIKYLMASVLLMLTACTTNDKEEITDRPSNENPPEVTISNFPVIDGSDSTTPLRTILMCRLLGFDYTWQRRPFTQDPQADIKVVYPKYTCSDEDRHHLRTKCLLESNTHQSYLNLINNKVELILCARAISRDENVYAEEQGVKLIQKPIANDALCFMVNPKNQVETLTTEQIQKIYTGEITNWRDVGGSDAPITPYVRNRNSGSQEKFETMIMPGLTIKDFPELQVGLTMMSPYYQLEADVNGIGFTPFYYYSVIVDNGSTKAIGVNGIEMSKTTVSNGTYPHCSNVYAAVRADINKQSVAYRIFEHLTTDSGQAIVAESGYVPLTAHH